VREKEEYEQVRTRLKKYSGVTVARTEPPSFGGGDEQTPGTQAIVRWWDDDAFGHGYDSRDVPEAKEAGH
jgi:hypothetical protein